MSKNIRCLAIKNNGSKCRQVELDDDGYCKYHQSPKFKKTDITEHVTQVACPVTSPKPTTCDQGTQTDPTPKQEFATQTDVLTPVSECSTQTDNLTPTKTKRRCSKCKQVGHNAKTCDKVSSQASDTEICDTDIDLAD